MVEAIFALIGNKLACEGLINIKKGKKFTFNCAI